ncbi:MAG: acyltransferase [Anaerolineae bacterium]|nr:acyltransferase [Phycisphaerae bacterium]
MILKNASDPPPVDSTQSPARLVALDAARFLAAIAIIWQHTPESPQLKPYSSLAAFAVPFFVAASILMTIESLRRKPDRRFAPYAAARFIRIYIPFLIWTAIYLLIRNLKHSLLTGEDRVPIEPGVLISGSAHHLWFLPFLFVLSLLAFAVGQLMVGKPWLERVIFWIALLGGTVTALMSEDRFFDYYILNRIWAATPAVLWGIALAAVYRRIPPHAWRSPALAVISAIVLIACVPLLRLRWHAHLTENLAGFALLVLGLCASMGSCRSPLVRRLAVLAPLAYGIYLSHVMFLEGMQAVAARAGYKQLWWLDLLVFVFTTAAAIVFTAVVSRLRWSRWLLPS